MLLDAESVVDRRRLKRRLTAWRIAAVVLGLFFIGGLLLSVIVTFGALSFFNALALGPLAEHLSSGDWQAEPASAGLGHRAGG